jgi:hypothetical protein
MKIIQYIFRILTLCAGVPALCSFVPACAHGYPKFICLTNVLLVCPTLKPPTIWQLGKNNLDRLGNLSVASDTDKFPFAIFAVASKTEAIFT